MILLSPKRVTFNNFKGLFFIKKTSIHQLYCFVVISNIFGLICGAVGSTVMIINYEEFRIFGKILGIIFLIVIVGFFLTLIIFPIK